MGSTMEPAASRTAVEALAFSGPEDALANVARVRDYVRKNGMAILRGILSPERLARGARLMEEQFDVANDLRSVPPFTLRSPNYHRLDIGTYGSRELYRFVRVFYYFPWNGDVLGMKADFEAMTRFRNALSGMDVNTGLDDSVQKTGFFYTLCINHYPAGGGFLGPHTDAVDYTQQGLFKDNFVVATPMSRMGRDFKTGGGWVALDGKRRTIWEEMTEIGDLLVYDQSLLHGCDPVDKYAPLDLTSLAGRRFAFASPTRVDP
jgi:hypothetical protein